MKSRKRIKKKKVPQFPGKRKQPVPESNNVRDGLAFLGVILVFLIIVGSIGIGIGLYKRYATSRKKTDIHNRTKQDSANRKPHTHVKTLIPN